MVLNSKRYHASLTMFVFIKGHHLLEYYFAMADAHEAANDPEEPRVTP